MLQLLRRYRAQPANIVPAIEKNSSLVTRNDILRQLRERLSLEEFGQLMFSLPQANLAKLSTKLPSMAPAEVQLNWTGQKDEQLLRASLRFVQSVAEHYETFLNRKLQNETILDYGCGYGRLARLMYYFTAPENFFGVDPWDESIKLCHEHGLVENFVQSEYLPDSLPVPRNDFKLIYAFSVFTHLSKRATLQALSACRKHIAADGMMVITIRPLDYWDLPLTPEDLQPALKHAHATEGFAFLPHIRGPVDGDVTYGDTSITTDWLAANAPQWQLLGTDHAKEDPMQILVFLKPV
jgi:SAM-dependent methyltransferase